MTVNEMLAMIPPKFRKATIHLQGAIETRPVLRVACHENDDGSTVVVLYEERLDTKAMKQRKPPASQPLPPSSDPAP